MSPNHSNLTLFLIAAVLLGQIQVGRAKEPGGFPVAVVLPTHPGARPDARSFINVATTEIASPVQVFNGVPIGKRAKLRQMTVSGIELEFGSNDPRQPLHALDGTKSGNDDIWSLTIIADKLTIRRPLRLPGTTVTIHTRVIEFDDADPKSPARIDTSPLPFATAAKAFVDQKGVNVSAGEGGAAGQSAGSVTLFAHDMEGDVKLPRFILNGGNGQDPGIGRDGKNGSPERIDVFKYDGRKKGQAFKDVIYVHLQGVFDAQRALGKKVPDLGSKLVPTDGENAVAGGKPGNGGNGGVLITNRGPAAMRLVKGTVHAAGGKPGKTSGPYRGGNGGAPGTWRHIIDDGINVWETKKGATTPGKHANEKSGKPGEAGRIELCPVDQDQDWYHPAVVEAYLGLLRDAYLNGHHDLAQQIAVAYLRPVIGLKVDVDRNPRAAAAHRRIVTLARQLQSGLDYFGNPPGWTPMLSLEVMYRNYQSQIESSMRVLSLTHWLESHWSNEQERQRAIEQLIFAKTSDIAFYSGAYNKAQEMLPSLGRELARIDQETRDLLRDLAENEQNLANKFKADEAMRKVARDLVSGMRSAAEMWSISGSATPMGAVVALSVVQGQLDEPRSKLPDTAAADALGALLVQDELEAARERFKKLSIVGARNPEEFKDELIKLSAVLSKATKQQIVADIQYRGGGVAATRLDELKQADDDFARLFDDTVELITQKMLFAEKLAETYAVLGAAADGIAESRASISTLRSSLGDKTIDPEAQSAIRDMQTRARDRLMQYKYYMVKAYEYRMLKPCPADFRNNRLFAQLARYFGVSTDKDKPQIPFKVESELFKDLAAVYQQDLDELRDQIIQEYSHHRVNSLVSQEPLDLTAAELERLNREGQVTIDLGRRVLGPADRNSRIESLEVRADRTKITSARGDARVQVTIEPADWCELLWGDRAYVFRYGQRREVSLARWGFNWDAAEPDKLRPFKSSADQGNVLGATGGDKSAPVDFRPGARTLLTIRRELRPEGSDARIERLGIWVGVDGNKAK